MHRVIHKNENRNIANILENQYHYLNIVDSMPCRGGGGGEREGLGALDGDPPMSPVDFKKML